jgi:hypothetical protein
MGEKITSKI